MKRLVCWLILVCMLISSNALASGAESWSKGHYVDEFGDRTGKEYAYIVLQGTFSNSATTDSELTATIMVDWDSIEFNLLQYGSSKVINSFNKPTYTVRVKDGNDEVYTFTGRYNKDTCRICVYNLQGQSDQLRSILLKGGKIRFSITDDNFPSTKYNFAINNAGQTQLKSALHIPSLVVGQFAGGIALSTFDDKMGAINTEGEVVIPYRYDVIYGDNADAIVVFNGESITTVGGSRTVTGRGKYGYIKKDGTPITEIEFDRAYSFTCGRAFVKKGDLWGCIDTDGKLVIPYKYNYVVSTFEDDRAIVFTGEMNRGNQPVKGEYAYIDLNGNVIFSRTESFSDFSDGLSRINIKGKYGFIDTEGKIKIKPTWDDAYPFSDGYAWVKSGKKVCIIDTNGKIVKQGNFNWKPVGKFYDGLKKVKNANYEYGYVNEKFELVIPCNFGECGNFRNGYTYAKSQDKEKYGIIDKTGTYVTPSIWDGIQEKGEYWCVTKALSWNRWGIPVGLTYGLIDSQGNTVLECEYNSIAYGEGYYTATKDTELFIFDENMNRIK